MSAWRRPAAGAVIAALSAWLAAAPVRADVPAVRVTATTDRAEALIGDPVLYTVTAMHPPGVAIEWPAIGEVLEDWSVEDAGVVPTRVEGGEAIEERWYRLAAYTSGDLTIPELTVTYRAADGTTQDARAAPVPVRITSLLPSDWERQEIRDAKPLVPVGAAWWWMCTMVAALAAGIAGWWWRRRRQPAVVAPAAPPRPAHELALEALAALRADDLPARGQYEAYYVRLSGIVRTYIERRFGLKAPDMTTEEFLQAVSSGQMIVSRHRQLLQEFLERCDLVKFARYEPSPAEADAAFEAAQRFVQDTAA